MIQQRFESGPTAWERLKIVGENTLLKKGKTTLQNKNYFTY